MSTACSQDPLLMQLSSAYSLSVPWAFLAGFYRLDLIFIITLKRPSATLIARYQLLSLIALTVSLSAI